ncbi:MAG: YbaB/EbfC family nucleoid-associated protein [Fimbriimonadaceae bacterium]|nr:YbaB/EbfC family nucleoid-associated protein [Fimbriimonadaceae bacterium]
MKLPKHFGGQGFQGMMSQVQGAMARAQNLEDELAAERIPIDKGQVKAVFNGRGELLKLSLDPAIVDPEDIEGLEDLIVGTIRDGFTKATELRDAKVQSILPNMPDIPGLNR